MESFDQMNSSLISANISLQVNTSSISTRASTEVLGLLSEASSAEISPGELSEQSGHQRGGEEFTERQHGNATKAQGEGAAAGSSAGREPDFETTGWT